MLLDGKARANVLMEALKKEFDALECPPGLAVVLVGNDPASLLYVLLKKKRGRELGVRVFVKHFPQDASEENISETIADLNKDARIQGILIQLPLPRHLNAGRLISLINPSKDVDGLLSDSLLLSPLLKAIWDLLKLASPSLAGKKATLFINSKEFEERLRAMLAKEGVICVDDSRYADIVICAKGKPGFLSADMIKKGAIVIDVGTTRVGKAIEGDADKSVYSKAGVISPVPGGVGPLTIAYLFSNLMLLAKH